MPKTLILGATTNPNRFAYRAAQALTAEGHAIVPVGIKKGTVAGVEIQLDIPENEAIDTVTLYLGAHNQQAYYQQLVQLKPRRVIFNPGTENYELEQLLSKNGIETERACTLVMLGAGTY